jgi:NfeD-like partner-binding protein
MLIISGFIMLLPIVNAGDINGNIRNGDLKAIRNVKINIQRLGDKSKKNKILFTLSNNSGDFEFKELEKGKYLLTVQKKGWVETNEMAEITGESKDECIKLSIIMRPSLTTRFITGIRIGSMLYVISFAILVLGFNFFILPGSLKGITIIGWGMILLMIVTSLIKLNYFNSLIIAAYGILGGGIIHLTGKKYSEKNEKKENLKKIESKKIRHKEEEKITDLLGKYGITISDLKPYGEAKFGDVTIEVKSRKGFLPGNTKILVTGISANKPVVEPEKV